jgi:hypothetical protein
MPIFAVIIFDVSDHLSTLGLRQGSFRRHLRGRRQSVARRRLRLPAGADLLDALRSAGLFAVINPES